MKTINTKEEILNLEGKPYTDGSNENPLTLGSAIIAVLDNSKIEGRHRIFTLIEKLHTQDVVEVDDADFTIIKKSIEATQIFTSNIFVGSLLKSLEG